MTNQMHYSPAINDYVKAIAKLRRAERALIVAGYAADDARAALHLEILYDGKVPGYAVYDGIPIPNLT